MSPIREVQVTFDCGDPRSLSQFWCSVLGYVLDPPPAGFDTWNEALEAFGVPPDRRNDASARHDPRGHGPRLFFQRVPEGKVAKNRVHLDVRAASGLEGDERMAALQAEAERLLDCGATLIAGHNPEPPLSNGCIVLSYPEGNEFCLD